MADALDRYDLETYEIRVYIFYINYITIRILFFEQKSRINKKRSNTIRRISEIQYIIKIDFHAQKAPEPCGLRADFLSELWIAQFTPKVLMRIPSLRYG